jgi:2-methylcitrate dehydratase PrpD
MTTRRTVSGVNRRYLMAGAGAAAVLAGVPFRARAAETVSPLMTRLSTYMAEAAGKPLPPEVVERGKQAILDTFAAMISGAGLPPGEFAIRFARAYGGEKIATVVASNVVCGPIEAALVNGMLAHSDETDDTHPASLSHPGAAAVPAALAACEKFGGDGTRFLRAVTLGYDIGTRVTAMLGKQEYQAETHRASHTISGTFCAGAAAGCAASLNATQMRWLLSYTAQQASGMASWQRDTQHIEKGFDFAGMPARNGVTAALLVQAGGTGVEDVFSGADNFLQAYEPMNDSSMLIDGLGTRYEVMRTDVKKWTVGSPIQAPLDALYNLHQKNRIVPDEVTKIVVRVAPREASVVNNREIPDINLQHMIAVMLMDKTASFKAAHDVERMRDPDTMKHRAKVTLEGDEELEKLMPRRAADVEVTMRDGRVLKERVVTVRGTSGNPMPRSEIIEKARDLIVPILGEEKFRRLSDAVFGIENVKSILELRPFLQKA